MHLLVHVLFFQLSFYSALSGWMTEYDNAFTFTCPAGLVMSKFESSHNNKYEDRVWNFGCGSLGVDAKLGACEWSGYINEFDEPMDFQCHNDAIVAGISSYHDNHKEDRRFKFYCCDVEGHVPHLCAYTPFINSYDHILNYRVTKGWVVRGVNSLHSNKYEDRIYRFDVCKLDRVNEEAIVGK